VKVMGWATALNSEALSVKQLYLILGVDAAGLRAARQLELNGCSSWRLLEAAHAQAARHTLRITERCRRPL